ncbi:hypothetical protein ACOBQX_24210 [Actinokineospora sp. G85]|uniref:hypothetical protein n=1 Tax=Actinokineospora sp. G85 TaxID=3406626 RepID=UPI003C743DE4
MAIDMGLDDPEAMKTLTWAVRIIDETVDRLRDEIGSTGPSDDSEVYRLARALPPGQMSLDRSIFAAADAARGALDQIRDILRNNIPTSPIVLQALLRSALVGSGRITFALFPADPSTRLQNARSLVAQESNSFMRALDAYAKFKQLLGARPDDHYRASAQQQNDELLKGGKPFGDGAVLTGAAEVIGAALAAAPEYSDENKQILREHVIWLWNTYSGAAHTYAWPRLLPRSGQDRRVPGDFPGDFFMVTVTAHVAMLSLQSRLQPGSANTTAPVPLWSEPTESP